MEQLLQDSDGGAEVIAERDELNRAVGRATLFKKDGDYSAFQKVLQEGLEWQPMRVLAYCVMPNHWRLGSFLS